MTTDRQPWRLGPRGERWFDVALVAVLALPALAFLVNESVDVGVFILLETLPLLWRRRRPALVFAAIAMASLAQVAVLDLPTSGQAAFPIALYSVARYGRPAATAAAVVVGFAAAGVASWDWLKEYDETSRAAYVSYFLSMVTVVVAAWALGALGRTREAYVAALIERGERIARDAEQRVELAAQEERARIAREMHDVVAHGLTTIVVQADGARYAAATSPETAGRALATISETGRQSLTEMRSLLGLLRSDDTGTAPVPTLSDLPRLVAGEEGVSADLPGADVQVPPGVGLAAYRIVQEALTNVRKHAGPEARARVAVRVAADAVDVTVTDDGRGATAPDDGRGHGIAGMRERAAVHGGTFRAGPRAGGGFEVVARIPHKGATRGVAGGSKQ
nr:histidine kinase [Nocardioides thalensis]